MQRPTASIRSVRVMAALVTLLLLLPYPMAAGGRRRAVTVPTPSTDLAIKILGVTAPGEDAFLEAGEIAHRRARDRRDTTLLRREFMMRIGGPARGPSGHAILRAFVDGADPRITVRVDGVKLGREARVIDSRAATGVTSRRTLEIEIPVDVPEGALALTIGWEAVTP